MVDGMSTNVLRADEMSTEDVILGNKAVHTETGEQRLKVGDICRFEYPIQRAQGHLDRQ